MKTRFLVFARPRKRSVRGGFTLIELLVVVLIAGIMASAAWPQYRMAVHKARVGRHLPLLRNLKDAQERYYMGNGHYAAKFKDLDIALAGAEFKQDGGPLGVGWPGETAVFDDYKISLLSGRSFVYGYTVLPDASVLLYGFRLEQAPKWGAPVVCGARSSSSLGNRICTGLGGALFVDDGSGRYYGLPF